MHSKSHWQKKKIILIQEAMNTCRMHTAVTYGTVASDTVEWMTFLVLADTVAALLVFSASENPPAQAGAPHIRGLSGALL